MARCRGDPMFHAQLTDRRLEDFRGGFLRLLCTLTEKQGKLLLVRLIERRVGPHQAIVAGESLASQRSTFVAWGLSSAGRSTRVVK